MCKILIMPGIKDETKDRAWEFIVEMSRQMSSPNVGEKDGIGYTAIDAEGNMFGERWLNNNEAFTHQNVYGSQTNDDLMKRFKILNKERVYNSFGTFNKNIRSITLHSRSATNSVALKNTHPFIEGTTSVIHNGVIYNDDKLTKKTSTCDSEVILHEYIKLNVANKIFKVKKLIHRLEGYYAMGIFAKQVDGTPILDIIKDDTAKLKGFLIKELETIVFATPKFNGSTVEDACKILGFTIESTFDVKSNKLQRLNALTGEIIGFESFKPKEFKRPVYNTSQYNTEGYWDGNVWKPWTTRHDDRFTDAYKKAFEGDVPKLEGAKIIETSKDVSKVSEKEINEAIEKELEKILTSNKEWTEEELTEFVESHLPEIVNDLTKEISNACEVNDGVNYNNAGETKWYEDDKFTWHRRSD